MHPLIDPGTMNAAAPDGAPPRRISDEKQMYGQCPAPPCLGEALRRGALIYSSRRHETMEWEIFLMQSMILCIPAIIAN